MLTKNKSFCHHLSLQGCAQIATSAVICRGVALKSVAWSCSLKASVLKAGGCGEPCEDRCFCILTLLYTESILNMDVVAFWEGLDPNCHSGVVCASRGMGSLCLLFAAPNAAATLTCFLPRLGVVTCNTQNSFWQRLGLAARHRCGDTCSVTSKYNWKECYGDDVLLSGGQHNMTAVWAVYFCPASTSFTWHGYCTFVKHPGTLLPRCMLCRALDRKHRQTVWFCFLTVVTTFSFSFFPFFFFEYEYLFLFCSFELMSCKWLFLLINYNEFV